MRLGWAGLGWAGLGLRELMICGEPEFPRIPSAKNLNYTTEEDKIASIIIYR